MAPRHVDVLLIGGGVAAARCARTLRRLGFGGSILLVGDEPLPPYNRPPLSKELLRDDLPAELVLAEPERWYVRRGVDLALATRVEALDVAARTARLGDASTVRFERCLLATGAAPVRAQLPGAASALLLRTIADAEAIRARAMRGQPAAVIGGGFIGVEVAASLAARGVAVTVFELTGALWGGVLGRSVSQWAITHLREAGVQVRLATPVDEVSPAAVRVGGEWLPASPVVMGVGVRSRTELAQAAAIGVDDGVVVDERQQTSVPGIFAAGDVARVRGRPRVEHWHAAREAGERAALAMLGRPLPPPRAPWIYSEFAGRKLDVFGVAGAADREVPVSAGVRAWLRDGRLTQLAVLDAALPEEVARACVERGSPLAELASLAAGRRPAT